MSTNTFDWNDYECFQNQLEYYLRHGRRTFNYHDFHSTSFPSKEELKRFGDVFIMALTGIGGVIRCAKTCQADGVVTYVVAMPVLWQ